MTIMIQISIIDSPIGQLVAGIYSERLCLLEFNEPGRLQSQQVSLQRFFGCPVEPGEQPLHQTLREELNQYFQGARQVFSLPLVFAGSEFQRKVWDALLTIPYGSRRTYKEVACQIGAPRAMRAVGSANGRNPIAVVVPCHRVVNKNSGLGGYGGGIWRKQWLLDLERRFA